MAQQSHEGHIRWIKFTMLIATPNLSNDSPTQSKFNPDDLETITNKSMNIASLIQKQSFFLKNKRGDLPVVMDSGSSLSLTPNQNNFSRNLKPATVSELNGLGSTTTVVWVLEVLNGQ